MTAVTEHAAELDTLAKAALDFANALRAIDGREALPALKMGAPGDCAGCPVAATANMGSRADRARWEVGAVAVKLTPTGMERSEIVPVPPSVQDFMAAFDAGMYPGLVEGAS